MSDFGVNNDNDKGTHLYLQIFCISLPPISIELEETVSAVKR